MMKASELIYNNPYRVLGVYVGDSAAKESSSKNRVLAFAKVGKSADIPMPQDKMLPPVERTVQGVTDAAQALSLPKDRIRQGLFWFADIDAPWATHLNDALTSLIHGDLISAVVNYHALVSDDGCREAFAQAATHGLMIMDREEMVQMLLEADDIKDLDLEQFLLTGTSTDRKRTYSRLRAFRYMQAIRDGLYFADETEEFDVLISDFKKVTEDVQQRLSEVRELLGRKDDDDTAYEDTILYLAKAIYGQGRIILKAVGRWAWEVLPTHVTLDMHRVNMRKFTLLRPYTIGRVSRLIDDVDHLVSSTLAEVGIGPGSDPRLKAVAAQYNDELETQLTLVRKYEESSVGRRASISNTLCVLGWLAAMIFILYRMAVTLT